MIASWLKSRRIFFVLASLLMVTTGLLLYWLYLGSIDREKLRLMDLALLHVQELETISKMVDGDDYGVGSRIPNVDRVKSIFDSQANYHRFGKTGKIVFLGGVGTPVPSQVVDQGETTFLLDEQGRKVLTVYVPFVGASFGVAATLDLQEIQLPYLQSGVGIGLLELLAMLLGGMFIFYRKDSGPQNMQDKEATIRAIVASAGEGIVTFNEYSHIETFNETAESMFLYQKG